MLRCVGLKINPRTYLRCGAYNLLPHRSDTQQCSVDPCSGRVILMKIYRRNAMLTHYLYAVRAFFSAPNVTGAMCAMYVAFKGADVWFFLLLLCRLADRIPFQLQMDLSHATCYHAMNASTKRTFARNEHFAEIRAYTRFPGGPTN